MKDVKERPVLKDVEGKTCFGKTCFVVGFLNQCVKFESCFL